VVVAMLMLSLRCRIYALKVQSRVIRLEERLRMERLLPEELKRQLHELTEGQFVALRFAPDEELAEATSKALAGKLSNKDIKKGIRRWRPDYFRV
jgi:cell division protein FtsL